MRLVISFLLACLSATACLAAVQGNATGASGNTVLPAVSLPNIEDAENADARTRIGRALAGSLLNAPTCYYIRNYRFERQDGDAPKLAGVTTCTPARQQLQPIRRWEPLGVYPLRHVAPKE